MSTESGLSVAVHPLRDPHHDLSSINNSADLQTIVESLTLCSSKTESNSDSRRPSSSNKSNRSASKIINNSQAVAAVAAAQSFVEAVEVLDKIREGSDMLRCL